MSSFSEIADRLLSCLTSGELDVAASLCAPDVTVRQNGGRSRSFEAVAEQVRAIRRVAPDWRFENPVRGETEWGFVEEHDSCGTLPDGTTFRFAICNVATIENGLITSIREYLDSARAKPLTDAMIAAAASGEPVG